MGASDFDEQLAMCKRMLAEHDRLIEAFKAEGRDLTEVLELREQLVALVKNVALFADRFQRKRRPPPLSLN